MAAKSCKRGHELTPENMDGNRACLTCRRVANRAASKAARKRRKAAGVRLATCPGCREEFTTDSPVRNICPTCNADPSLRDKARRARTLALEVDRDAEMVRNLEADKRPVRWVGPITAEDLIRRWGRG